MCIYIVAVINEQCIQIRLHIGLKIIMLDHQNNYIRRSSILYNDNKNVKKF